MRDAQPAPAAHHRFVEHTGEVRLHLEAGDLVGLFTEAAGGLAELMAERAEGEPGPVVDVALTAPDVDALLVDWLNEIIFHAERTGALFVQTEVREATPTSLEARLLGVSLESPKTAVKAATFFGLHVERRGDRWEADVVLDV